MPQLSTGEAALFCLGRVVATPLALETLMQNGLTAIDLLTRHAAGDWGDIPRDDAMANQTALLSGSRLFSSYRIADNAKVWIITDADRSATTILLPSDY